MKFTLNASLLTRLKILSFTTLPRSVAISSNKGPLKQKLCCPSKFKVWKPKNASPHYPNPCTNVHVLIPGSCDCVIILIPICQCN